MYTMAIRMWTSKYYILKTTGINLLLYTASSLLGRLSTRVWSLDAKICSHLAIRAFVGLTTDFR